MLAEGQSSDLQVRGVTSGQRLGQNRQIHCLRTGNDPNNRSVGNSWADPGCVHYVSRPSVKLTFCGSDNDPTVDDLNRSVAHQRSIVVRAVEISTSLFRPACSLV